MKGQTLLLLLLAATPSLVVCDIGRVELHHGGEELVIREAEGVDAVSLCY